MAIVRLAVAGARSARRSRRCPTSPSTRSTACRPALKVGAAPNDILEMPTSTGQRRHMRRIGTLEFTLKGESLTLTAFADASDTAAAPAVRAVLRSDQRHRNLSRRALSRSRSHGHAASTTSTSTAPTTRSACSTPSTTARCRRARTAWRCRSAPARSSEPTASDRRHRLRLRRRARRLGAAAPPRLPGRARAARASRCRARSTTPAISATTTRACSGPSRRTRRWPLDDAAAHRGADRREGPRLRRDSSPAATCSTPGPRPASRGSPRSSRSGSRPARRRTRSRRCSRRAGLAHHFRFVVASGDTAGEQAGAGSVPTRRRSCTACAPGECLAIEDSRWGIASAKAAGLWCIGITNTYPVGELLEADAIITSLDEFTPALIRVPIGGSELGVECSRAACPVSRTISAMSVALHLHPRAVQVAAELEQAMNAPGDELAPAAFAIARVEYPALDPAPYLALLDGWAMRRRRACGSSAAPTDRRHPRRSTSIFYDELGFTGNREHYDDPRNSFLNEVLDRRTGIPISLAVVYLEVARRAGLRVAGVNFPGHFLLRAPVTGPHAGTTLRDDALIVDPFHRGALLSEAGLPRTAAPARRRRRRVRSRAARPGHAAADRRAHAREPETALRPHAIVSAGALHLGSAARRRSVGDRSSCAIAACSRTTCRTLPARCAISKPTCGCCPAPAGLADDVDDVSRRVRRGRASGAGTRTDLGAREDPPQARRRVQLNPAGAAEPGIRHRDE